MINKPFPFDGLNIRTPSINPVRGRGLLIGGLHLDELVQELRIKARVMQVAPGPSSRERKAEKDNTTVAEPPSKKSTFLIVYQDKGPPRKKRYHYTMGRIFIVRGWGDLFFKRGKP